jgi:hypothetical protein|tara:strand:+ start:84 stop:620 length:537 start_codon:yes stop_codon:yes gene_type:complete
MKHTLNTVTFKPSLNKLGQKIMAIIEVLALAGAVTKIAGSISSAVKAGKDLNSLMPSFGKLAALEADINLAETGKHKGPLGRLTSSEEEGFAIAQAKMAHKDAQNLLRETCQLYGPSGMWDMVVRETAAARVRKRDALDAQAAARDRLFYALSVAGGIIFFVVGSGLMFWGAATVADL